MSLYRHIMTMMVDIEQNRIFLIKKMKIEIKKYCKGRKGKIIRNLSARISSRKKIIIFIN